MPLPRAGAKFWSFAQTMFSIGGITLADYGADGGIGFDPQSDEVESNLSADGIVHYADNHDRRLRATIKVMNNSFAADHMFRLAQTQRRTRQSTGLMPPIMCSYNDPITRRRVVSAAAVFITVPGMQSQKEEGELEFVIEFPYGRENELYLSEKILPVRF